MKIGLSIPRSPDPEGLRRFAQRAEQLGFESVLAGDHIVLPTGGTARFASALSTEDFVKRMSVIEYSSRGLAEALPHVEELSRLEGLHGHGAAAAVRVNRMGGST